MNRLNRSSISPVGSQMARLIIALWLCLLAVCAQQSAPQVQFVRIQAGTASGYGPVGNPAPGETLGLRITGLSGPGDGELRVYGLVNRSSNQSLEFNQTTLLAVLNAAELQKQNVSVVPSEVVVPLPARATQNVLELTVVLANKNSAGAGVVASLSLNQTASVQEAPSLLKRFLASGSELFGRLMNAYDNVRASPESRSIFVVSLQQGKPLSVPRTLALPAAQYRGLALSPQGGQLASVMAVPGGYELWISNLDPLSSMRIAASSRAILTPFFADENTLVYVSGSALALASTNGQGDPKAVETTFRSVSGILSAKSIGQRLECIVTAEHSDTPGLSLPYLVRIRLPHSKASAIRLASSPYYGSYALLVDGVPFFFAGWNAGIEGIHYLPPDASGAKVSTLFKVHSPGLITLASNGSRLAFAGGR